MTLESRSQPIYGSPQIVTAFAALQAIGLVGSLLVLCTVVLSKDVKRYSTWISFNVSWILLTLSYLLLFLSGEEQGQNLGSLCVMQASLVYSMPVLCASTSLSLILHIWQTVSGARGISIPVLIGAPYAAWAIMTGALLVRGAVDITGIRLESGLYCGFVDGIAGDVSAALVMLVVLVVVFFEARILQLLLANRRKFPDSAETTMSIPIIIRVVLFNFFGILTIASGAGFLTNTTTGANIGNILVAVLPVAFVLVFGTQTDILRAWMFWKSDDDDDYEDYPPPRQAKV